jgi:glycosyltransferase involved in cell wall biosynthesis
VRILYDGQVYANQSFGGAKRIFQRLIDGLPPDIEPVLTCCERGQTNLLSNPRLRVRFWQRYGFRPRRVFYWIEKHYFRAVVRWERPNLIHPTYYDLLTRQPISALPCPAVVTVYDMIHEIFPSALDPDGRLARVKADAVRAAAAVICISETTRRDLLERIPVPVDRVSVIHLAGGLDPGLPAPGFHPPQRPYLLHVGSRARAYKNFDRLLRAFARVAAREPDPVLAVVGKPLDGEEVRRVADLRLEGRVLSIGPVSDGELAALYRGCVAVVYPSLYEGFGIPLLEAMACGAPVVCSDGGSLPEVAGDAALLFEARSDEALAAALGRVLEEPILLRDLRERGFRRVTAFDWRRTIDATVEVYRRVAR